MHFDLTSRNLWRRISTVWVGLGRGCTWGLVLLALAGIGCRKTVTGRSTQIKQAIAAQKNKSDNLREGLNYLRKLTPVNRVTATKEVVVQLNTWLRTVPKERSAYSPSRLTKQLPTEWAQRADCNNPLQLSYDAWDVDYLFQCQLMRMLSSWIVDFPVRDRLFLPTIAECKSKLSNDEAVKLEEAYKLFDWTIRNIVLDGETSSVEKLSMDVRPPLGARPLGCGSLPWETALFSVGDYVERGRLFAALAQQRGINTVWLSLNGTTTSPGYLWAVAVLIGSEMYLFDPKLGLPIIDPDTLQLATLKQARENDRILKRLDLVDQFDYAVNPGDLKSLVLLIDALPTATSARMKVLEESLLGTDRMQLFINTDVIVEKIAKNYPADSVAIWNTPLYARDFAAQVRDLLNSPSEAAARYLSVNGVWVMDTPISGARMNHLSGKFESNLDEVGALATYMACKVDPITLERLAYDPDVQKEMGIPRQDKDTLEQHQAKVLQAQMFFAQAKIHAMFLIAQLHFDRGNYDDAIKWVDRLMSDKMAQQWHAGGQYLLARAQQELGQNEAAERALTFQPSSQEAGNRLRLRILRRDK
jgi:hypothetical protein